MPGLNLTPPQIASADYPIARTPSVGSDKRVKVAARVPSRRLGILRTLTDGGAVASVTVSNEGTGYTSGTVTFAAAPEGGTTATGTVVVSGGKIVGVNITNGGAGYTSAPSVTFGGDGDDAAGTAVLGPIVEFEFENLPSSSPGPIVAAVCGELRAAANAVIAYAGLSAAFAPPGWAKNQTSDFAFGKAVELIGTYSAPNANSVPTITNAKRGTVIHLIELPPLAEFVLVGTTKTIGLTLPTQANHAIADRLNPAKWMTKARGEVGQLDLSALDHGSDDGLSRFNGMAVTVMIEDFRQDAIIIARTFLTNIRFGSKTNVPEGSEDTTKDNNGMFQDAAILAAP